MVTMQVSLPDPLRQWIDDQVEGGGYADASAYIRDLIQEERRRQESLRTAIAEGMESGRSPRKAEDIMAAAKARLARG